MVDQVVRDTIDGLRLRNESDAHPFETWSLESVPSGKSSASCGMSDPRGWQDEDAIQDRVHIDSSLDWRKVSQKGPASLGSDCSMSSGSSASCVTSNLPGSQVEDAIQARVHVDSSLDGRRERQKGVAFLGRGIKRSRLDEACWQFECPVSDLTLPGDFIRSPPVRIGNHEFCIKIFPMGPVASQRSGRVLKAVIDVLPDVYFDSDWRNILVDFNIKLQNVDPTKSVEGGMCIFLKCTFKSELDASGFLFPDRFIRCTASVRGRLHELQPINRHVSGTARMFAECIMTDSIFPVNGANTIAECDREVLVRASPVFEKMCGSTFKESNAHLVTFPIHEVSYAVAYTFVAFLYTAALPLHADWIALIQLADMYDIQPLIEACMEKLAETSTANVIWTVDQLSLIHI